MTQPANYIDNDINDVQITQNMSRPKDEELNICERLYR